MKALDYIPCAVDVEALHGWLEGQRRLRPDPSSYARGRLGFWLRSEPSPGRWSVNTWKVGPKWRAAGRQSRLL